MNTKTPAINISHLGKTYKNSASPLRALNDVSFTVEQGEFFGLLGPNGAGKSTLINVMAGLVSTDEGSVHVLGASVSQDFRKTRRDLGVVPQEIVIDPFLTVRQTLQFQSGYFGIANNESWIDELLTQLDLLDKQHVNMRQLSGGMKRRVLIAQALVHKPAVLILDEPTAGVDVVLRQTLWKFVRQLHKEGHTIILTTHYLEEAEQLCDRIAIINQGELVALEDKNTLLKKGLSKTVHVKSYHSIGELPTKVSQHVIHSTQYELQLSLTAEQDLMALLDMVRSAGVSIAEVSVQSARLEDVFVQMTQKTT